jgi:hypothetical protein
MPDQPDQQLPIDERLNAISMHLEIVAGMQEANGKAIATLKERTIQVLDAIKTRGRIAGLHEEQLDELDQRLHRLEDQS